MKLSQVTGFNADVRTYGTTSRLVDSNVDLGVEIELENLEEFNKYPLKHHFWHVTEDGSLRNYGREFILCHMEHGKLGGQLSPIRGKDFVDALDDWAKWHKKYCEVAEPPQATKRTSIHVHVDVRGMDVEEIGKFILLYATFEPTLFKILNNGREEDIYCTPFALNFQGKARASRLINNHSQKGEVYESLNKSQKYESMNLRSILQRGSIEFRIHHGTTDTEEILRWVNILLILRRAAMDEDIQLIDYPVHASNLGLINFVGNVFKEYIHIIADHLDEELLLSGVRQAQDIMQISHLEILNKKFSAMGSGAKAGDDSIIHKWAKKNSRNVYID